MKEVWKVLNLYAGIGGNRKLWEDVEVTAVEINPDIAKIYQDFFPRDNVIVGDAHEYLLKHYDEGWDFIWSSPPCPTHSKIRNVAAVGRGQNKSVYPDMRLYEEIVFLNQISNSNGETFDGRWIVENIESYYEPLIVPKRLQRHYFWSNYEIADKYFIPDNIQHMRNAKCKHGFDLSNYNMDVRMKGKILRNCVSPELGKHIMDCARKRIQTKLVS